MGDGKMLKYINNYQFPSSLQTPLHWNYIYISSFQNTPKKCFDSLHKHKDVPLKMTIKINMFDISYGINRKKISQITWANSTANHIYINLSLVFKINVNSKELF